jgi:hypothetical protein
MYQFDITGDLYLNHEESPEINMHCELDGQFSAQLSINEDGDRPQLRCAHCYHESDEDAPQIEACPGSGKWGKCLDCEGLKKCSVCENVDADECAFCAGSGKCDECDDDGEIEIHDWELIPLHWVNCASITADPQGDRIMLDVSVRDPRGCLRMEIRHTDDGRIFLHVPYVGMSSPHAPLTEVMPGTMQVGS